MITARTARTLAAFALVVAAFATLAAILTSGTPARAVQQPSVAVTAPAAPVTPEPAGNLPGGAYTADEAFLADLFGPGVDVSPEQALYLTEIGKRYCTFVVEGQIVPGAQVQTRGDYLASLTSPTDPHALTLDEATKLLDVAEGAYCPPAR